MSRTHMLFGSKMKGTQKQYSMAILVWIDRCVLHIFLHVKGKNTLCGAGWYPEKGAKGQKRNTWPIWQSKSFRTRRSNWGSHSDGAHRENRGQNARSKSHSIKWFSAKSRKPSDALWFSAIRYESRLKRSYEYLMSILLCRIVCVSHYNATDLLNRTSANDYMHIKRRLLISPVLSKV